MMMFLCIERQRLHFRGQCSNNPIVCVLIVSMVQAHAHMPLFLNHDYDPFPMNIESVPSFSCQWSKETLQSIGQLNFGDGAKN